MNICFLMDDFSATGGIQRVVPIVASSLNDSFNVKVVSIYNEHNENNKSLYKLDEDVHILIEGKKNYLLQCMKASNLLRKYLKDNNIDILISTSEMLTPYCLIAKLFKKTKFYCWTHSTAYRYNESILQRPFKFLTMHYADKVIALTNCIKNELDKKYKTNNIVVIPNPIDSNLINDKPYNKTSKKIISVGRFCYEKYYEKLIEVAKLVLPNNVEWTWDVYGDGNEREKISEEIKKNKLDNRVILKGNVNNIYELYNEYSFLVMTSRSEAYPMALLEGIASKLPLIAFDIPGVNELIINNTNGVVVNCFSESEMAKAINEMINNCNKRIEYSNNNSKLIEKYKINTIIEQWERELKK